MSDEYRQNLFLQWQGILLELIQDLRAPLKEQQIPVLTCQTEKDCKTKQKLTRFVIIMREVMQQSIANSLTKISHLILAVTIRFLFIVAIG